jgi:hypothetical protein
MQMWTPSAQDEERVRRLLSRRFGNVARFGPHEYEVDDGGRRVPVLVKWRRTPGRFTIPDVRLGWLKEAGGYLVLVVTGRAPRLLPAAEAERSGLVKVWRYRRPHERGVPRRSTVPVHITLSREVLEAVDASKGRLTRSRHIDSILRSYFGLAETLGIVFSEPLEPQQHPQDEG